MASSMSNRDEIFELAQLEVLGVLESPDVVRLDRMFREASPAVQREIVELQSTLARDEWRLLPMIDPSPALGWRVVARVMEDVDLQDEHGVPLASIGRKAKAGAVQTSHPNTQGGTTSDTTPRAAIAEALAPWRRSSFLWRATSIILAGGLLASIALNLATSRQAARISELALQGTVTSELLEFLGPDLRTFLDQRCIVRGLVATSVRDNGSVGVLLSPDYSRVMVQWIGLPTAQRYMLRAVDGASGVSQEIGSVSIVNQIGGTRFDSLPAGTVNAASDWELVDEHGTVIFRSRTD